MVNNFYNDLVMTQSNMLKIISELSYICQCTECANCPCLTVSNKCFLEKYEPVHWSAIVREIVNETKGDKNEQG